MVRKEESDRLRDVYLIGDIDKDTARTAIERLRELANGSGKPITVYVNSAGGQCHRRPGAARRHPAARRAGHRSHGRRPGHGVLHGLDRAAGGEPGRRLTFPHSWIMIHEPAKWAGWQSTTAAAQHLDRLKQMQSQIYRILADRSGKPLRQIIRDTRRVDFYLDAAKAKEYGLIDDVIGEMSKPVSESETLAASGPLAVSPPASSEESETEPAVAAQERPDS